MINESMITSSREKAHLLLSNLFKQTFGDLSNLDKTSLNAWILERLADIQRDLAVSMTLERDEFLLNTCKKISTARSIGYNYGFNTIAAKPATGHLSFVLILPLDFIDKSILIKADETKVFADDVPFMFPGDILVVSNANRYIQAVRRTDHIFKTKDNIILPSITDIRVKDDQILFGFISEVKQLDFVESYFIVEDHLELTNSVNKISFNDNFFDINIWYNYYDDNSDQTLKQIITKVPELSSYSSIAEVFTQEIESENTLKITMGDGLNGKYYASGKEINYRLYSTKGTSGNMINPSLTVGLGDSLLEITCQAQFVENPSGGVDEYGLIELKDAIRKKIQTPGVIITDTDIKNVLSDILNLKSEEVFHRLRRNDPIERILDIFIMVKDRTNPNVEKVVPTNTIDVEVNLTNVIENDYNTISPMFLVETSKMVEGDNTFIKNRLVPSFRTRIPSNLYYSHFYAIKIQKNPLNINFFNLIANYNLMYEHKYTNLNYEEEVYINSAMLERDIFAGSKSYIFSLTLDSVNQEFLKNNNLIIRAMFFNNDDDKSYGNFYIDFSKTTDENGEIEHNRYQAKIESLDVISDSNNLFIKNIYKMAQKYADNTELWNIDTTDFKNELIPIINCEICIFYNYDSGEEIPNQTFKNIRDVRTKILLSTYTINDITLYQDISEIIYCKADYIDSKRESIIIKSMPLISENFITNIENKPVLLSQVRSEKTLKEIIDKRIEFPSNLSLKYFNTYGYSDSYLLLENVSLKLDFEVSYKNNKTISASEIEIIKNNLINYINNINKRGLSEDKNIYISDLVSIVRQNTSIVQCRVLNFNDNIFLNKSITSNINYIPTALQLSPSNITFITKSV